MLNAILMTVTLVLYGSKTLLLANNRISIAFGLKSLLFKSYWWQSQDAIICFFVIDSLIVVLVKLLDPL